MDGMWAHGQQAIFDKNGGSISGRNYSRRWPKVGNVPVAWEQDVR
jgi:hypothetical protein